MKPFLHENVQKTLKTLLPPYFYLGDYKLIEQNALTWNLTYHSPLMATNAQLDISYNDVDHVIVLSFHPPYSSSKEMLNACKDFLRDFIAFLQQDSPSRLFFAIHQCRFIPVLNGKIQRFEKGEKKV